MLNLNLKSVRLARKHEFARFQKQGTGGVIVNTSSFLFVGAVAGSSIYSASKGGLDAMMRALAIEGGAHGIRVNNVNPGTVVTEMFRSLIDLKTRQRATDNQKYLRGKPIMKKAFITGANKSIGFETARQLLRKGYYVYLGSRSLENGREAVETLKAEGLNDVEAIRIDVSSDESVKAARAEIGRKTESLDVLINNAGINGGVPQTAIGASLDAFKEVFATNVFGVVRGTQAFLDLLQKSPEPRIVNVSSSMGSLTLHNDPAWKYYHNKGAIYHPSKAALNMYTIVLAYELRDTAFKVNAVDPGFVATDFNNHRGTGTVEEAGARLVKYAVIDSNGPTGKFFSEETNPETGEIPW